MKQLLLILFAIPNILFGQEVKKVTKKIKNKNEKEIFYVLKSNKSIKHGEYFKYNHLNNIIEKGNYKNGDFSGVWEYYNHSGKLEQKYNFTDNKLEYFDGQETYDSTNKTQIIINNDTLLTHLDSPPMYIGGNSKIFSLMLNNLNYPIEARDNGLSGKVYVSFVVTPEGKAVNHKIHEASHEVLNKEALRFVKEIPDSWIPGILNKTPVYSIVIMPVNFSLR